MSPLNDPLNEIRLSWHGVGVPVGTLTPTPGSISCTVNTLDSSANTQSTTVPQLLLFLHQWCLSPRVHWPGRHLLGVRVNSPMGQMCCPFSTVIFVLWCLSALLHSVAKMQHLQEQGPCFAWFVCPVPSTKQGTLLTLKSFFFFPVTIPQGHWALDMLLIQGPRLTKW